MDQIKLEGRKILFVADLHIRLTFSSKVSATTDSRYGLKQIIQICSDQNVGVVILGGDVFDRVQVPPELILVYQAFIDQLLSRGIEVLAIAGNHDRVYGLRDTDQVTQWYEMHPDVRNIDSQFIEVGDRLIYGMSYCEMENQIQDHLDRLASKPDRSLTVVCHQMIKGCKFPTFNLDEDRFPPNVREILIGDIHAQLAGVNAHGAWWAYPGPMFPQAVNQAGNPGVILLGDDIEQYTRLDLQHRQIIRLEVLAEEQVEPVLQEMIELLDNRQQLPKDIERPIVYLRSVRTVNRHLPRFRREAADRNAYISVDPVSVLSAPGGRLTVDSALDELPTPLEIFPKFAAELEDSPKVPIHGRSTQLCLDLLRVAASTQLEDDESGKSLKGLRDRWKTIIADAVDREEAASA